MVNKFNSIELFTGTGGLALGLKEAGFKHDALFEWDSDSCYNINQNILNGFPGIKKWNIFQTDVRTVDYSSYQGKIHLVAGGPPCQPFSLGGKHQAYNDSRDMFPEAIRAVKETQAPAFIFENVKGLLRKSFATYFNYILLQLTYPEIIKKKGMEWLDHLTILEKHHTSGKIKGLSYKVVFRLLNAADYGVPQTRQRVIIVGFRNDLNVKWAFPNPTHSQEALLFSKWISKTYWEEHKIRTPKENPLTPLREKQVRSFLEKNNTLRWQTTRDAIGDLPNPRNKSASKLYNGHIFRDGAKVYAGHCGSVLDEPSKTIKAGAHGVPGGENMIRLDDGTTRYYTVRESARIQTFPDNYKFYSSSTESMRQIGNAVPVLLAKKIGESVIEPLKRKFYD